jgi:hypothetical protein
LNCVTHRQIDTSVQLEFIVIAQHIDKKLILSLHSQGCLTPFVFQPGLYLPPMRCGSAHQCAVQFSAHRQGRAVHFQTSAVQFSTVHWVPCGTHCQSPTAPTRIQNEDRPSWLVRPEREVRGPRHPLPSRRLRRRSRSSHQQVEGRDLRPAPGKPVIGGGGHSARRASGCWVAGFPLELSLVAQWVTKLW